MSLMPVSPEWLLFLHRWTAAPYIWLWPASAGSHHIRHVTHKYSNM